MTRWVVIIHVDSGTRPGIVERVARIFADRGISLSDLLATTREGSSTLVLGFAASQRLCDYLVRRLARFEEAHSIQVHPDEGHPPWAYLTPGRP